MSECSDPPALRRALVALGVGAAAGALVAAVVPRQRDVSERADRPASG